MRPTHEQFLYEVTRRAFESVEDWAIVWARRIAAPPPRSWLGSWAQANLDFRDPQRQGRTFTLDPVSIGTAYRTLHRGADDNDNLGMPVRALGRLFFAEDTNNPRLVDECLADYLTQAYIFGHVMWP